MSARFTIDGGDKLERRLAVTCEAVAQGVRGLVPAKRLQGLVLAGGYGRGEGGVLFDEASATELPYNDMEFFVFVKGSTLLNDRRHRQALHALGESLSEQAGLEVEFKILSLERLHASGTSMFFYDLVMGHRWLIGDGEGFSRCAHHRDASRIPLHEATRLLFNRCSGLLFAKERLQRRDFSGADADFVGRNLAKAQLAFGDAVLTALGRYHWSCRERQSRLAALQEIPAPLQEVVSLLKDAHAQGVSFKLHPVASRESRDVLQQRHAQITALGWQIWRWLEERRLGMPFPTAEAYAGTERPLCPETFPLRNHLINMRTFGPLIAWNMPPRYPRERLFRALALMLWTATPSGHLQMLRKHLHAQDMDFPALVQAYAGLWQRFN